MYGEVQLQGNWGLSLGMNSKYTLEWYHYVSDMMPLQKVDLLSPYVVGDRDLAGVDQSRNMNVMSLFHLQ